MLDSTQKKRKVYKVYIDAATGKVSKMDWRPLHAVNAVEIHAKEGRVVCEDERAIVRRQPPGKHRHHARMHVS